MGIPKLHLLPKRLTIVLAGAGISRVMIKRDMFISIRAARKPTNAFTGDSPSRLSPKITWSVNLQINLTLKEYIKTSIEP